VKDKPSYESRIPSRFRSTSPSTFRSRRAARPDRGPSASPVFEEGFVQNHGSTLSFLGLTLGVFISRKFLVVPIAVALTFVMDALRGILENEASTSTRR
jgi:hypothetical protein